MNSNPGCNEMALFPTAKAAGESPGEPILEIEIPGRLPSWNDILGMEQWARYQFKRELAAVFLFELRHSAADSSTKTTSAKNTMSIFAATLERYLATQQAKRALKQASKKSAAKNPNLFASKSTAKIPF